ncbi:MAG: DUF488 family protein [Thaumarchaeota archaeon]|nr:DUF488 family protein [Nitrososphaerota archaeon]
MLKTKQIYASADPSDGRRILVARFYPRGVKREHFDDWVRELAPSPELLRLYKRGRITPTEYAIQYQLEINNDRSKEALHKLEHEASTEDVTLLCYEPEGEFCHRCILKRLILQGNFRPEDIGHYK